jgi:hypothetical protein
MEHNRYIGPAAKFKEFFVFLHQKSSASEVKLEPYPTFAEVSGPARFNSVAVWQEQNRLAPTPSTRQKRSCTCGANQPLSPTSDLARRKPISRLAKMANAI